MAEYKHFRKGTKFDSYAKLETAIRMHSERTFTKFYRRDSRKISSGNPKVKFQIDPKLVYYEIKFACRSGGKKFYKKGKKGGRERGTFKTTECPVHIALRASRDGKYLVVKSHVTEHNHETSEALYARQRALTTSETEASKTLLKLQEEQDTPKEDTALQILKEETGIFRLFHLEGGMSVLVLQKESSS